MKYYEIWFYYYGEEDIRTDFSKEFTFYIKSEGIIKNTEELILLLKNRVLNDGTEYKYWLENHLDHISNWFEISPKEFEISTGIKC